MSGEAETPGKSGRLTAARLSLFFAWFLVVGLGLAWRTLNWPMVYDDLHLIRSFTSEELLLSFRGSWDPDRIETPGFRPFTTLFNHARYALFGESVAAHRIFLVSLYAFYLTLLVPIACRFGMSESIAVFSATLSLCARYSVYHYVWLSDGIHLLPGIAFVISALLLLGGLAELSWLKLSLALGSMLAGVLTREDALAVVPILLLLGSVYASRPRRRPQLKALCLFAGVLAVLCLALLKYRGMVVPGAPPLSLNVTGLLTSAGRMLNPMGVVPFDTLSRMLIWGFWVHLPLMVVGLIYFRDAIRWRMAALWLLCAFFACSPSLSVRRDNLLLFPVTFISLFYGSALEELGRISSSLRRWAGAVLISAVAGGAYVSWVFAENFHPYSARVVWYNGKFIYGPYSERASIPEERRRKVVRQLGALGIRREQALRLQLREMVESALRENRRRPGPDEVVFFPLLLEEDLW